MCLLNVKKNSLVLDRRGEGARAGQPLPPKARCSNTLSYGPSACHGWLGSRRILRRLSLVSNPVRVLSVSTAKKMIPLVMSG